MGFQNETFSSLGTPFWISKGKFQTLTSVCWNISTAKEREVYLLTATQHRMTKLKWNKTGPGQQPLLGKASCTSLSLADSQPVLHFLSALHTLILASVATQGSGPAWGGGGWGGVYLYAKAGRFAVYYSVKSMEEFPDQKSTPGMVEWPVGGQ